MKQITRQQPQHHNVSDGAMYEIEEEAYGTVVQMICF